MRHNSAARDKLVAAAGSQRVKWRSMAYLYMCAGAAAVATVFLGMDPEAETGVIGVVGGLILLLGVALRLLSSRMPSWLTIPALVAGLVMVTAGVLLAGEPDNPYLLFYVWTGVEAWFFL